MSSGKDLKYSMLLDYYSPLLTRKQADSMSLYYNEDLSLSEIAEDLDISRQAVHDLIKRSELILDDLESKLNMFSRSQQINELCDMLERMDFSFPLSLKRKEELIKQIRDLI